MDIVPEEPPVESKRVEVTGASLEVILGYQKAPDAPVICAAHPSGAFGEATVRLLRSVSGASVVCVNSRGIGDSSPVVPPGGWCTLDQMVDDLEGVRGRLGLGAWLFWGMSGGGWLGQAYARRYPQGLSGLILESVCACFRERLADPSCVLSPFHPPWREALAERGLIALDSHLEVGDANATEWIEVEGVGSVFRRLDGPALLVSPMPLSPEMRAAMPVLWSVDARGWLRQLRIPTLVIGGSADPIVPVPHVRSLHEAIPGSQLVIVPGGGHAPVAERRAEVKDAVRRFLRDRVA